MCTGVELRWLATLTLVEIKFSCTQVDATFSPFGHQTHPVRCFYNPLASEVQDMFSWNDLRLTCTCKETWESVCPGLDCFLRFEEVTYTLLSFLARFLDYGEESWKNEARESLKDLNTWVLTWRYCVFVCFLFLGRWQARTISEGKPLDCTRGCFLSDWFKMFAILRIRTKPEKF